MSASKFRSLLVGCGGRGGLHARVLSESDRTDLVAVCDTARDRAHEVAETYNVPAVHTDYHAALEEVTPDHVTLATPPTVRRSVIDATLSNGSTSLLVEKPIANSFEEVRAIEQAVREASTKVAVCHQHIHCQEYRAVKRWVDAGRLGDVKRLTATTKYGLLEHGTHLVHALNWFTGATPQVVRGHCSGASHLDPDTGSEGAVEPADTTLELAYPGNVRAFCHLGPESPDVADREHPWNQYRIDIVGEAGTAGFILGQQAVGIFQDGREAVSVPEFDPDGRATTDLYASHWEWIAGERHSHPATFNRAVAAHRVAEAAMRSTIDRQSIDPSDLGERDGETVEKLRAVLRDPVADGQRDGI